jgi:hypothetical protein
MPIELQLIENAGDKMTCVNGLKSSLEKEWQNQQKRFITWRPEHLSVEIIHNERWWYAPGLRWPPQNYDPKLYPNPTPRFWNPFGKYVRAGPLPIGVEINIPLEINTARIAGFFATDNQAIYLMHDPRFSGKSKKSRALYLKWSKAQLQPVEDTEGKVRYGVIVAQINCATTAADIEKYVQSVMEFKQS